MSLIKDGLSGSDNADSTPFTPSTDVPRSDAQAAIDYGLSGGAGGAVADDAEFLVRTGHADLTNERVVTDTDTITWDFGTLGQASANWQFHGLEDLSEPAADRGVFWDKSYGGFTYFEPGTGMSFVGNFLSCNRLTVSDLTDIDLSTLADGDVLVWDSVDQKWEATSGIAGASGAPSDAQYYVRSAAGGLSDETVVPAFMQTLLDDTSASEARTTLGLVIGTDVQAYDAGLQSISGLTTAANKMIYTTALDTYAVTDLTAFARSILDDADEATFKATVNLEIGVDVQAYDAELAAIAGLTSAADKLPYFTGLGTAAVTDFTSVARTLVNQTTQALMRTTGLGMSANGSSLVSAADYAAMRALLDLEAGTDFYSLTALASTSNGQGASLIGVEDAGGYFSTANIEGVLQEIGADVAALGTVISLRGTWDASSGSFPGGGTAQAGYSYIVSVSGTVDGVAFVANDRILAITNNASTSTYAANWHKLDYTDQVLSVDGMTGAVSLSSTYQPLDATLTAWAGITVTQGALFYGTGSDAFAVLAKDTNATRYLSNTGASNNPAWAQIDLTNGVTGDLPFANLTQGSALSVLGVTGNATADVASIAAGSDDQVLRRSGTSLAFGTVATGGIADDAVTFAKMQNISTDRLLGRDTAASGNVEEIALNATLEFDGSQNLRRAALTGAVAASAGSNATTATSELVIIIDGGGSTITTGVKGDFHAEFAFTIQSVTMLADQSGSIVVDVWKDTYANYPATVADTITASAKPTITTATKSQDTTLTGWTTSVSAGDTIRFNVDSVTSITRLTMIFKVSKTS